ncbi:hypothetical protein VPNG_07039 [Cytospora leucostoma]|uniref:Uncharacterized protein n=1 Tax=Cytospora leucostoma TaxID=1230097 RepID=A0A423WNG8_9PEZI|nr:hypothetical protein VPNG_07039 [Cytospora leucostoma]
MPGMTGEPELLNGVNSRATCGRVIIQNTSMFDKLGSRGVMNTQGYGGPGRPPFHVIARDAGDIGSLTAPSTTAPGVANPHTNLPALFVKAVVDIGNQKANLRVDLNDEVCAMHRHIRDCPLRDGSHKGLDDVFADGLKNRRDQYAFFREWLRSFIEARLEPEEASQYVAAVDSDINTQTKVVLDRELPLTPAPGTPGGRAQTIGWVST